MARLEIWRKKKPSDYSVEKTSLCYFRSSRLKITLELRIRDVIVVFEKPT